MSKRSAAMAVLITAQFMDLMDAMITNVALPSIQRSLHASAAALEWTLGAYVLMFAVLLITGGRLGDIAGRRRVFLVGVLGFSAASLGACVAHTGTELVLARGAQGTFAAMMVPQVLSTAQVLYAPEERGAVFGLMGALGGIGVLTGQLLGGFMISADAFGIGWRSVFIINVPIGLALAALAVRLVPETRSREAVSLDLPGVTLVTAGMLLIIYPLIAAHGTEWSVDLWGMLAAGLVSLGAFVAQQRRRGREGVRAPLLPVGLFTDRGFRIGSIVQLANYVGWGSFALTIPLYLQEGLHFSALRAGLAMVPVTVGSFLGTALAPAAGRRGRSAVLAGAVVEAIGFVWYAAAIHGRPGGVSLWGLAGPLGLTGVGMILLAVPLMAVALRHVGGGDEGAASGTFTMLQQFGNVLGVALAGTVFFRILGTHPAPGDYRHAILAATAVTVGAFAVAAIAALALPRQTGTELETVSGRAARAPRAR